MCATCEARKDAGDCPLIGVDRKRERATCIYPHGDQQAPFHCQLSMIRSDIAGDGLLEFSINDTAQLSARLSELSTLR